MDRIRTGFVLGALLATTAAPAASQDLAGVCGALGGVDIGERVAFRMEGAQAANVSAVRFAFVDRDDSKDTWFEVKATTPQGEQIVQLQVPDFPFGAADIAGGIVKPGPMPAMRMPEQMLGMMRQQMASNPMLDIQAQCLQAELLGEETLDGPKGGLKTWHLKVPGGNDAWVSPDVPFGMVKGTAGDGSGTMVLTDYGTGASSSISEQPQSIPAMPGMPPQN
jgi:hypothetical protein